MEMCKVISNSVLASPRSFDRPLWEDSGGQDSLANTMPSFHSSHHRYLHELDSDTDNVADIDSLISSLSSNLLIMHRQSYDLSQILDLYDHIATRKTGQGLAGDLYNRVCPSMGEEPF